MSLENLRLSSPSGMSNKKVYVGNVDKECNEEMLEDLFHKWALESVWIARNPTGFAVGPPAGAHSNPEQQPASATRECTVLLVCDV